MNKAKALPLIAALTFSACGESDSNNTLNNNQPQDMGTPDMPNQSKDCTTASIQADETIQAYQDRISSVLGLVPNYCIEDGIQLFPSTYTAPIPTDFPGLECTTGQLQTHHSYFNRYRSCFPAAEFRNTKTEDSIAVQYVPDNSSINSNLATINSAYCTGCQTDSFIFSNIEECEYFKEVSSIKCQPTNMEANKLILFLNITYTTTSTFGLNIQLPHGKDEQNKLSTEKLLPQEAYLKMSSYQ